MHPTVCRQVSVLLRSQLPKHVAEAVPQLPFGTADSRNAAPKLIEHLKAQKEERDVAYTQEKAAARAEKRTVSEDVPAWPSNLRFEPAVKRERLGPLDKEVRRSLKGLLKER